MPKTDPFPAADATSAMDQRREIQWGEMPYVAMPNEHPSTLRRVAGAVRRRIKGLTEQPGDQAVLDEITSLHVRR